MATWSHRGTPVTVSWPTWGCVGHACEITAPRHSEEGASPPFNDHFILHLVVCTFSRVFSFLRDGSGSSRSKVYSLCLLGDFANHLLNTSCNFTFENHLFGHLHSCICRWNCYNRLPHPRIRVNAKFHQRIQMCSDIAIKLLIVNCFIFL